ncbi:lipoate--protein ligase family protein, partial [Levilactobacillus brevis]
YQDLDIQSFREALLCHIFEVDRLDQIETYHLSAQDWAIIDQRLDEKYRTDAWNYGANPGFRDYRALSLPTGQLHVNFTRQAGHLKAVALFGTVGTPTDLHEISEQLVGIATTAAAVRAVLLTPAITAILGPAVEPLIQVLTEDIHEG